jgi:hypothetical protein
MRLQTIILTLMLCLSINLSAQTKGKPTVQNKTAGSSIYSLPPFERAVLVIKHYETFHINRYPYIGYGHRIQKGEKLTSNITHRQADSLLRSDLKKLYRFFLKYGEKHALLLATLAYNVGPTRITGNKRIPESRLLSKIKRGEKNIQYDYVDFCRYRGKKIASIQRRRWAELRLLYAS